MKSSKNPYPAITALGVKIYDEPIAHVFPEDIKVVLTKKQQKLFNTYFGSQTCPLIGDKQALYPWDCESVIVRMTSGKLQGSQLFWD